MKMRVVILLLALTGCTANYLATAPGAAMPSPLLAFCGEYDSAGRCKDWSPKTDQCINPKGVNEPEPIVSCNRIINGKYNK